jgi:hypothetical protein
MQAFQKVAQDNFEGRAVQHLRTTQSAATAPYSDDQLRQRVHGCVSRAGKYGLTTERQVMSFVDATYLAGEHFDTAPECAWAPTVLNSQGTAGDARATLLVSFAQLEWDKARREAAQPGSGT